MSESFETLKAKIRTLESTVDALQGQVKAYEDLKSNGFDPAQAEPYFILLARDPIAPSLVEAWAHLRMGMASNAMPLFENLVNSAVNSWEPQAGNDPQIRAAFTISRNMSDYRRGAAL